MKRSQKQCILMMSPRAWKSADLMLNYFTQKSVLPYCGILALFTPLQQRRDLVHGKFLSRNTPQPPPPTPLFSFFPVNFKTCPEKRPNCPVSLKCRTKSGASCARPLGALMFSGCLDLPSVTAPHAFESCVRIFFCLSYDNLFSSSSPQVLRFCHRLQKQHYKIKEQ